MAGEKSVLVLSDGSQVTLNADTKLKYPDRFDGTNREVYLEGEGYFVVQHISVHPFVVHAGNLSTTVLGTTFNVSAYPESKTIAVSLLEGKVKVTSNEKGTVDKTVVLEPKEQLLYDKEKNVGSFGLFDSLESVGWKDNIYKFVDEPLGKVFSQLERAYGIKFKITDQPVLVQRITVKFEKNSLQTVVDVMKSLTGLNYRLVRGDGKVQEVVFFGNAK
ncbi:MAG: FecR domain-containing protein [Bacteroidota bacterium]